MKEEGLQNLVSVKTLSQTLDIKERTIREWVARREIPYHKLGKLVRFDVREIQAWITKASVPSGPGPVIVEKRLPYYGATQV